jgi:hypothetical protein
VSTNNSYSFDSFVAFEACIACLAQQEAGTTGLRGNKRNEGNTGRERVREKEMTIAAAQAVTSVPVLDRTCRQSGCDSANTRCYMNGWRCKEHSPAAMAGRPEPQVDPALTLGALQAKAGKSIAEQVRTTTNYSATGAHVSLLVWPPDPELQRIAELVDSIMGAAALACPDCGEPYTDRGFTSRCRSRHQITPERNRP